MKDNIIISLKTKAIFKKIYKKKRFTKTLLDTIKNESWDNLYKKCKKAGYTITFDFV